jgi:nucleotide-binding universal stress UspA family protein
VSHGRHVDGDGVVLVCYDGSEDARSAIEALAAVATGQPVVVATFWQPFASFASRYAVSLLEIVQDPEDINARELARAEALAEEGAGLARSLGLDAEHRAPPANGALDEAINGYADELGARLVVIGSRGRSSMTSTLLGDVAADVVQRARRPVLVVPGQGGAERRR